MVLRIIKKIARPFIRFYVRKDKGSEISGLKTKGQKLTGRIRISGNSTLHVGSHICFSGFLSISENSKVTIEDGCRIRNVEIRVCNHSQIFIGKEVVLEGQPGKPLNIFVDNGKMYLEGFNNVHSHISIQFGGSFSMGKFTGIGSGSDIVCHESIIIGSYGLFSYDILIYDTDSHSTDYRKRRDRIEAGHPVGTSELERPNTKPVNIGDDVWLGRSVIITKGAQVGNRCIIGMGAILGSGLYPDDSTIISEKPRVLNRKTVSNG